MGHLSPLTAAELAAIYDRDPSPSVLRLLQEIRRLHETIRRADQVRRTIGNEGVFYVPAVVWECFVRELEAEPCLRDLPTPRQQARIDEHLRRLEEWRKNGRKFE
ncbi:hypothetical protein [Paraburkholderia sp.]|uniref:hypothetical protein n=1 Tax=Paraburkholderia sp. TaxID=1926495 RepID=UPI0039E6EB4C